MKTRLADLTWPEAKAIASERVLIVPVGSTEQHGPHLPVGTDTLITDALCEALIQLRPGVALLAPTINFSSSGEHSDFVGTISIGQGALELLLVELARSADAFGAVAFISAHGGNAHVLARVARLLAKEGRCAFVWWPRNLPALENESAPFSNGAVSAPKTVDLHAGRSETSMMLALKPDLVRFDAYAVGLVDAGGDLLTELKEKGVAGVSPNGVLGDPFGAGAPEGDAILARLQSDLCGAFDHFVAEQRIGACASKEAPL